MLFQSTGKHFGILFIDVNRLCKTAVDDAYFKYDKLVNRVNMTCQDIVVRFTPTNLNALELFLLKLCDVTSRKLGPEGGRNFHLGRISTAPHMKFILS